MKTIVFFTLLIFLGYGAQAQNYTVLTDSLRLPVGLEFDGLGRLWVVESGYGFDDGAVSILNPDGHLSPVIVNLPALFDSTNQESVGPWHTHQLSGQKMAVIIGTTGEVATFDLGGFTPDISTPLTYADALSSLNVAQYAVGHGFLESDPYTMALDQDGTRYIADAAANAVFKADASGQLSVFATFPAQPNPIPVGPPVSDAVPTRIIAKPGGGFWVCQLTGFPFMTGSASVFSLDAAGNLSTWASGLTTLTDMTFDPATGNLYALQIGQFELSVFNFLPNSARVIRIKPDGSTEIAAENLDFASGLALDASGNLYVAELASGRVLKLDGVASAAGEAAEKTSCEFSVSPNPASGPVHVRYTINNTTHIGVRVLDAHGQIVRSYEAGRREAGTHELDIRLDGLPAGSYWIDIQTDTEIKTRRIILH